MSSQESICRQNGCDTSHSAPPAARLAGAHVLLPCPPLAYDATATGYDES
jgi:hypothetical protein